MANFKFQTKNDTYDFKRKLNKQLIVEDTIYNFPMVSFFQDNLVNDFVFASGNNEGVIYKFSKKLKVIDTIKKQGPGPKEFQNPLVLNVLENKIVFSDNGQNSLKSYNRKTQEIKSLKSNAIFFQFSFLNGKIAYLSSSLTKDDNKKNGLLFRSLSLNDDLLENNLIGNDGYFSDSNINYAYQGEFCSNKSYSIFYPLYGGKLVVFNNNFKNFNLLTTVDETDKAKAKKVSMSGYTTMKVNKENFIYIDATLDKNNKLYLLNRVSDYRHNYVDIYNIPNKSYIQSYKLPLLENQKPKNLVLIEKQLFILYSDYTLLKCQLP